MSNFPNTLDLDLIACDLDVEFTRFNNQRSLRFASEIQEQQFGNAVGFIDRKRPDDNYYNRVIGLRDSDSEALDAITGWYSANEVACTISLPPQHQTNALLSSLQEKGFRYIGSDWNFCHPLISFENEPLAEIEIHRVTQENFDSFLAHLEDTGVKVDAFVAERVKPCYLGEEFSNYLALIDGEPVASGSLYVFQGIGWLSNAITLPKFRNRGCQTALLRARIERAAHLQCESLFTDTLFGSASHRNVLRAGFELAYCTAEFKLG